MRRAPRLVIASALMASAPALAQTVPLHVRDCEVASGETAVLVIEVCQPRPISQGQICVIVPGLDRVKRVKVMSAENDAVASASIAGPDEILLTFSSPSASINLTKGALALVAFRLDPSLPSGTSSVASVDASATLMLDPSGAPIPVEPTPGRVRIRPREDPFVLYAFSDYGLVGDSALVEVATRERLRARDMMIDFEYEEEFFTNVRDVFVFPKARDLVAAVDASIPGRVRVRLRSDSGRLNDVPGSLFWVELVRGSDPAEDDTEVGIEDETSSVSRADGSRVTIETLDYEIR